jgi:acetylornithine deacetylase/succinyl-diaminopimelate desuccinylase-like protein
MVGVTRTTCVATMLRGGHAENALPQSATATVTLQGEPGSAPPSPLRDDVMDAVRIGVDAMYPDVPIIPYQAPYATDVFRFREAGIPTYGITGLFIKGSNEFAHRLDERVEVRTFFAALEFWKAIVDDLAGRPVM